MVTFSLLTTRQPRLRLVPLGLLVLLLLVGAALFRGFGIGWDEFTDHNLGNVTANYVADSLDPEVLAYRPSGGIKALSIFRRDSLNRSLPPTPIGVGHRP